MNDLDPFDKTEETSQYSHEQKWDDRRARSHDEIENGNAFSQQRMAEEGLATREPVSYGDTK